MSREYNRIKSDVIVRQLKPRTDGKNLIMLDGSGLPLVVAPAGRKYWQFKTKAGGKDSTIQLGIYPALGLAGARNEAAKCRELVKVGLSPRVERQLGKLRNRQQTVSTFSRPAPQNQQTTNLQKECCTNFFIADYSGTS